MSIPAWAKVGAKVVCIKRDPWNLLTGVEKDAKSPEYGEVCVIEGFIDGIGVPVCCFLDGYNDAYAVRWFRPVKTIEDDISEHFAILLRTPSKVDA